MTRTIYGNLTGRAAVVALAEFQNSLLDDIAQETQRKRFAMTDARDELIALDPAGWESWWDSDAMPEFCTYTEREKIIRNRIAEIKRVRLSNG